MKPLLEMVAVAGLLFIGYAWLLERRVDFRWCRRYLTLLPLLSVVIPLLQIPLWPGRKVVLAPLGEVPHAEAVVETAPEAATFGWVEAFGLLYGAGVLLLLGLMAYQVWKISLLERGAEIETWRGIRVVRTSTPIASFSFFGTVYLSASTPEEELLVILRHEESHIRHRHSWERLWMELWRALLWWNPFIWLAARRLTEVEEFEADRDVLLSGEDTNHYIQTLFKQLFGYSPDIANGLRNSLTKKRFQMMTQKNVSRYARLRAAATLSLVMALVVAFGSTARATQYTMASMEKEDVFVKVDQMPTFEGGDLNQFRMWVMTQIQYPKEAVEKGVSGHLVASFVVDEQGQVVQVEILQSPDSALSEEVSRVLAASPRWKPGVQKGEKVKVRFVLPVIFSTQSQTTAQEAPKSEVEQASNVIDEIAVRTYETPQQKPEENMQEQTQPMLSAEKMPSFQGGGLREFQVWVAENMKYPQEAIAKKISGRVLVQFVINEEGAVTEVKVLQSPHALLSSEAIRVVSSSPRWEPGMQKGQKVSVRYVLPLIFNL